MNIPFLNSIVKSTNDNGKSIGAFDESRSTIEKRVCDLLSSETITMCGGVKVIAKKLREIQALASQGGVLGGVILSDDTMEQKIGDEKKISEIYTDAHTNVFYKVDKGLISAFPGSTTNRTKGMDSLESTIEFGKKHGANGAKWRALLYISDTNIEQNCIDLALYAKICQEMDIVPIVEPEIFIEGDYSITQSEEFSKKVMKNLLKYLDIYGVSLSGMILKPSFVSAGNNHHLSTPDEIADHTHNMICTIPENININFLSGGHSFETCVHVLNILNNGYPKREGAISASFGRALIGDKNNGFMHEMKKVFDANGNDFSDAKKALLYRANIIKDARTLTRDVFKKKYAQL